MMVSTVPVIQASSLYFVSGKYPLVQSVFVVFAADTDCKSIDVVDMVSELVIDSFSDFSIVPKFLRRAVRVQQEHLSPIRATLLPPRFGSRHCLDTSLAHRR